MPSRPPKIGVRLVRGTCGHLSERGSGRGARLVPGEKRGRISGAILLAQRRPRPGAGASASRLWLDNQEHQDGASLAPQHVDVAGGPCTFEGQLVSVPLPSAVILVSGALAQSPFVGRTSAVPDQVSPLNVTAKIPFCRAPYVKV